MGPSPRKGVRILLVAGVVISCCASLWSYQGMQGVLSQDTKSTRSNLIRFGMEVPLPSCDVNQRPISGAIRRSILVLGNCTKCSLAQFDERSFLAESPRDFTVIYSGKGRSTLDDLPASALRRHRFVNDRCTETVRYAPLLALAPVLVNLDASGKVVSIVPAKGEDIITRGRA